jgi:hypothetical protein
MLEPSMLQRLCRLRRWLRWWWWWGDYEWSAEEKKELLCVIIVKGQIYDNYIKACNLMKIDDCGKKWKCALIRVSRLSMSSLKLIKVFVEIFL